MRTYTLRTSANAIRGALVCIVAAVSVGCTKQEPVVATPAPVATTTGELDWARDALKRNPTLELVATDTAAGVFTVRFKDTGEVRTLKLNEIAAAPVSTLTVPVRTATALPDATPPVVTPSTEPALPTSTTASTPAQPEPSSTATLAQPAPAGQGYSIERAGGQVKVSGPGVSIVSTGTSAVAASTNDPTLRGSDPIICEGRRMLHFDNRNIYVDGDAIIARGGCELYITNSRVVAAGTGVIVRNATVHIANSTIEGGAASFDAGNTSKLYVRSSTFQGLPRRAEGATIQDQGGNQWR